MEFKLHPLKTELSIERIANVHFFEFEQNFATKPDNHPFRELVFVSGGKLNISSDDFNGVLNKNEAIIHRASVTHSLFCTSESAPTVIIIGFECTSNLLDVFSHHPCILSDNGIKKLAEIIKEARNVFAPPYNISTYNMRKKENTPYGSEQLLKNLLEYFLIGLIRENIGSEQIKDGEQYTLKITEIVKYLDDNFMEKITLDELAFIFHTNRSTLCKSFRSATGHTVNGYLEDKKLAAAVNLMETTDKSVTQIAEELNFESIHYFSRFFKKRVGTPPREYKKLQKK